jgi:hypothetical protein
MPGRTWVIAPDAQTLSDRWEALVKEKDPTRKELLFHPHEGGDRTVSKTLSDGLAGHEFRPYSVGTDQGNCVAPSRIGFRSFDRQWIIPDKRLINRPNPTLWDSFSAKQVYLTALSRSTPRNGPALSITGLVPDLDHYKGSAGGRVFPLWADAKAAETNLNAAVLAELESVLGDAVPPEDLFTYIAAVGACPAYTARFAKDLKQPGLRIPLTADKVLFAEAAALGREIVWLHTFGERCVDAKAGRPAGPPRLAVNAPTIPKGGAIPGTPEGMPDELSYDEDNQRLFVGKGFIDNVTPAMWGYEVSGVHVLLHWFSYRKKDRSRPVIGDRRAPSPLEDIRSDVWLPEYTSELLNVLNILGRLTELEPAQADLLARIVDGPTISVDHLREIGAVEEEY